MSRIPCFAMIHEPTTLSLLGLGAVMVRRKADSSLIGPYVRNLEPLDKFEPQDKIYADRCLRGTYAGRN